jgi:hypothetical protein
MLFLQFLLLLSGYGRDCFCMARHSTSKPSDLWQYVVLKFCLSVWVNMSLGTSQVDFFWPACKPSVSPFLFLFGLSCCLLVPLTARTIHNLWGQELYCHWCCQWYFAAVCKYIIISLQNSVKRQGYFHFCSGRDTLYLSSYRPLITTTIGHSLCSVHICFPFEIAFTP